MKVTSLFPKMGRPRKDVSDALEARPPKGVERVDKDGVLVGGRQEAERGVARTGPKALPGVVVQLRDACHESRKGKVSESATRRSIDWMGCATTNQTSAPDRAPLSTRLSAAMSPHDARAASALATAARKRASERISAGRAPALERLWR